MVRAAKAQAYAATQPKVRRRKAPAPAGLQPVIGSSSDCLSLYYASPSDRIGIIKRGLPALDAADIIERISVTKGEALRAVNIPQATMTRWVKLRGRLPPAESERVLGVGRLLGQVEAIVRESGNPDGFDASAWLTRWLREPLPALAGARPLDMLDTIEGQRLVSDMLSRMQSGAYV